MAKSVNKVILIGNLGKDPEVRHLENGTAVASFSLATSESYKDKNTGQIVTNTDWHNIVVWRGLAEVAEKYAKKGDKIYIEGKIKSRSYQDQEGITKYVTEIVADNLVLMGRPEGQGTSQSQSSGENSNTSNTTSKAAANFSDDVEDDDLPF